MNTQLSNAKEIRIPGPDHPITISPAEGKVRVNGRPGRIVAESIASTPAGGEGAFRPVFNYFPRNSAEHVVARRQESRAFPLIVRTRADCA